MKIISFFKCSGQEHWLGEIEKCEWGGGAFLYELLSKQTFFDTVGENSELLLLTEGDRLVSFCTFAEKDDIQPTELTPWIGFVYSFPGFRGHRYFGLLLNEIERLAEVKQISALYISTNHIGLYEKYGFEYMTDLMDIRGELSRVYIKRLIKKEG